jgi:hypothetical protein
MIPGRLQLLAIVMLLPGLVASEMHMFGGHRDPRQLLPIATLSRPGTAGGNLLAMGDVTGLSSTAKTLSILADGATTDAAPAPAEKFEWLPGIAILWGILMVRLAIARKRREGVIHAEADDSTEKLTLSGPLVGNCSGDKAPLYREVIAGYNRLKDGTASTGEVDDLRRRTRSLLGGCDGKGRRNLRGLKALLDWLDNVRTSGRITITVQQLLEKKMGSWDIECGIDAGGRTIKAKKSVKGNAEVNGCVLQVPWDANGGIKVWMHLTDDGYETCWGHFGPITMSSAAVLQDPSGMSRAFHTDQFDKDFKLVFKIQRNFSPLPRFANDMIAVTDAAPLKA